MIWEKKLKFSLMAWKKLEFSSYFIDFLLEFYQTIGTKFFF